MMISIIISTRNRSLKITACISSILQNLYKNCEIIVIDQSIDDLTKEIIKKFKSKKIKYFRMYNKGKSKALNYAITKAYGEILAFTDDDCIVDKDWLKNIIHTFSKHSDTSFIIGKVYPYQKNMKKNYYVTLPNYNKHFSSRYIWKRPSYNTTIVSGNNMAIKRKLINKIGNFKDWLGPGSISYGGDDTEFAYRALINRYQIIFDPAIIVYHDNWLKKEKKENKDFYYSCSFISIWLYYFLLGNKEFVQYIRNIINNQVSVWINYFRVSIKKINILLFVKAALNTFNQILFILRSFLIAIYYSYRSKYFKTTFSQ